MLTLTHEAAEAIRRMTEDSPPATDVRLSAASRFRQGDTPNVKIEIVPWPETLDTVIEAEGVRLYVQAGLMCALDHKVLDVESENGETQFALLEQADEPFTTA